MILCFVLNCVLSSDVNEMSFFQKIYLEFNGIKSTKLYYHLWQLISERNIIALSAIHEINFYKVYE